MQSSPRDGSNPRAAAAAHQVRLTFNEKGGVEGKPTTVVRTLEVQRASRASKGPKVKCTFKQLDASIERWNAARGCDEA